MSGLQTTRGTRRGPPAAVPEARPVSSLCCHGAPRPRPGGLGGAEARRPPRDFGEGHRPRRGWRPPSVHAHGLSRKLDELTHGLRPHTHVHTHTRRAHTHVHTNKHTHARMCTLMYTHTCTCTHARTHKRARARTRSHTHPHAQSQEAPLRHLPLLPARLPRGDHGGGQARAPHAPASGRSCPTLPRWRPRAGGRAVLGGPAPHSTLATAATPSWETPISRPETQFPV